MPNKAFNYSDGVKRHRRNQLEKFLNFNLFLISVPILYPLKTPENLCLQGDISGKVGTLRINRLIMITFNLYQTNHSSKWSSG